MPQDCLWHNGGLRRPDCLLGARGVRRCLGSPVSEAGKINRWNHYISVTPENSVVNNRVDTLLWISRVWVLLLYTYTYCLIYYYINCTISRKIIFRSIFCFASFVSSQLFPLYPLQEIFSKSNIQTILNFSNFSNSPKIIIYR